MQHKRIVHIVILVVVIVAALFIAHTLNLGPALAKAFITLHGGR